MSGQKFSEEKERVCRFHESHSTAEPCVCMCRGLFLEEGQALGIGLAAWVKAAVPLAGLEEPPELEGPWEPGQSPW